MIYTKARRHNERVINNNTLIQKQLEKGAKKEADLSRTSLGEIRNDEHLLGGSEGTNDLSNLQDELLNDGALVQRVVRELAIRAHTASVNSGRGPGKLSRRNSRLQSDECIYCLTCQLVSGTNHSSLGDTLVKDESRLDFGGGETVTGDVDNI